MEITQEKIETKKKDSEINQSNYSISDEENTLLEANQILKENHCNYLFILKNYGKCSSFINEIIQTEGITIYEHLKLKEAMRVILKIKLFP